ncbi:response regulator [Dactylosporangium siamense]|uniref:DNA-binding response regulator n=1 Tax=Dactylosporangium siamense TaxID=685454 RepID=A0A919UDV9_9ACTN|nr:response regulator transcription factor [Dactylosporangium siamense]GIG47038.1 DNA-binding response regulator [Dactylosporangium siamense]
MTADAAPIRVLIADDHLVVRRGITALLTSLPGIEVVAEASTGTQALREAQLTRPDVVIMDLQMPDLNGIEATRRLGVLLPDVAVLVLTMFEDDDSVLAAMRAGARGYLLKGSHQDELLSAVRSVVTGHVVIGPGIAGRLIGFLSAAQPAGTGLPDLTPRERDILDRVAQGHGNAAIAADLGVTPKTVSNHVSTIFAKLRVASRAEAIERARREGLGRADDRPTPAVS